MDTGGDLARWAILVGIMAGCWTISRLLTYNRRVIIEVLRAEFRLHLGAADEDTAPERRLRSTARPGRTSVD